MHDLLEAQSTERYTCIRKRKAGQDKKRHCGMKVVLEIVQWRFTVLRISNWDEERKQDAGQRRVHAGLQQRHPHDCADQ